MSENIEPNAEPPVAGDSDVTKGAGEDAATKDTEADATTKDEKEVKKEERKEVGEEEHFRLIDNEIDVDIEFDDEEVDEPRCLLVFPPSLWGWARWHGSIVYLHWASFFHKDADKLDQQALHGVLEAELRRWRLSGLHHPRLIDYYGVYWSVQAKRSKPKRLGLIMEVEGRGEPELETLRERSNREPSLTHFETASVMRDIASAMSFAHSRGGNWHGRLHANDVMLFQTWGSHGSLTVQNAKVPFWGLFDCVRKLADDNEAHPLDGSDMRCLGLLGLECYMGRRAIPDSDKYIQNVQYIRRNDELTDVIRMLLTRPVAELPTAKEIVAILDDISINKRESQEHYFDALCGEPKTPRQKIEQLEGRLKQSQVRQK